MSIFDYANVLQLKEGRPPTILCFFANSLIAEIETTDEALDVLVDQILIARQDD